MRFQQVCIESLGYTLPEEILSSDEIEHRLAPLYQRLRLPEGRLELMSGIKERRPWYALSDDVPKGKVTDFYRAVKAEDGEKIVFSFVEWPDKDIRDQAWAKIMADESLKPEGEMPFDGKRMFWGGFEPIVDTAKAKEPANV